jgi:hypothetical protein
VLAACSAVFRFDTALPILITLDTTVTHRADRTLHLAAEELPDEGRGVDAERDAVGLKRSFFLNWVRLADQVGFDTLGTVDRPNDERLRATKRAVCRADCRCVDLDQDLVVPRHRLLDLFQPQDLGRSIPVMHNRFHRPTQAGWRESGR